MCDIATAILVLHSPLPLCNYILYNRGLEMENDLVLIDAMAKQQPDMPSIFHLPKLNGQDLFEISVDDLQHCFSSGIFSSEEYIQFCLDRIQAVNPYLEAIIETNPDAIAIARQFDVERKNGNIRGPLHGVPVAIKDASIE